MSDRICIHSKGEVNAHLSAENLVSCCYTCGFGCNGGFPGAAWSHWVKKGIVTGGNYNSSQVSCPQFMPILLREVHSIIICLPLTNRVASHTLFLLVSITQLVSVHLARREVVLQNASRLVKTVTQLITRKIFTMVWFILETFQNK